MTAKEYLSQLITMDNAINRKQQRLMTLRDVAMNTTPNYSGETVQHTRNKNPLENRQVHQYLCQYHGQYRLSLSLYFQADFYSVYAELFLRCNLEWFSLQHHEVS